jgi:hypothetical protein
MMMMLLGIQIGKVGRRRIFEEARKSRVIPIIEEEGGKTCGLLHCRVDCKLGSWQPRGPIFLVGCNVMTQVFLKDTVHPFSLAISFRMIRGGEIPFDIQETTEFSPESTGEFGISVRDNGGRSTMMDKNILEEETSHIEGRRFFEARNEVDHLGKPVHNNHDGIIAFRCLREISDEIHGNISPRTIRIGQRLKQTSLRLIGRLIALARVTCFHICMNIITHCRPPIMTPDKRESLVTAHVTSIGCIMTLLKNPFPESKVVRDHNGIVKVVHTINKLHAVDKVGVAGISKPSEPIVLSIAKLDQIEIKSKVVWDRRLLFISRACAIVIRKGQNFTCSIVLTAATTVPRIVTSGRWRRSIMVNLRDRRYRRGKTWRDYPSSPRGARSRIKPLNWRWLVSSLSPSHDHELWIAAESISRIIGTFIQSMV